MTSVVPARATMRRDFADAASTTIQWSPDCAVGDPSGGSSDSDGEEVPSGSNGACG